jgi:hypothetical protein
MDKVQKNNFTYYRSEQFWIMVLLIIINHHSYGSCCNPATQYSGSHIDHPTGTTRWIMNGEQVGAPVSTSTRQDPPVLLQTSRLFWHQHEVVKQGVFYTRVGLWEAHRSTTLTLHAGFLDSSRRLPTYYLETGHDRNSFGGQSLHFKYIACFQSTRNSVIILFIIGMIQLLLQHVSALLGHLQAVWILNKN